MSANRSRAEDVALLGGPDGALLGGVHGGFMGPQPAPGYRLEIRAGTGDGPTFDSITGLSVNRRHTAISDWSATVPHGPGVERYELAPARLYWGDTVLFNGRYEQTSGDLGDPEVKLQGRGIAVDLARGDVTLDLSNVRRIDAIRQMWRNRTPFDATVLAPDDPDHPALERISNEESDDGKYSGTPLKVLKELHEDGAMRFTVLHSRPGKNVESYPIGSRRRRHDWRVEGGDRDSDSSDYANRVVFYGAFRSDGSRLVEVARDEDEIEAMRERNPEIGENGVVTYPIYDETESDPAEARSQAKSKLIDLVEKGTVGGSLEIMPTVASPGHDYFVPEFGGPDLRAYGEGQYGTGTYGSETGQYVTLNKISYEVKSSITGEATSSCSVDLSRSNGFADTLERAYSNSA